MANGRHGNDGLRALPLAVAVFEYEKERATIQHHQAMGRTARENLKKQAHAHKILVQFVSTKFQTSLH